MHRRTFARAGFTAAAVILLAGQSPALASDAAKSPPPAKALAWGKNKAAFRAFQRGQKESHRCSNRGGSALKDAAQAALSSMSDLAATNFTPEEVQALSDAIDTGMAEALAQSMAALDAAAEQYRAKMVAAGATDAQLAKLEEAVGRARDRLQQRSDRLNQQLDDKFAELFAPPSDDESDDSGDDADSSSSDDKSQDPPPAV